MSQKGGLVATGRLVNEQYHVHMIMRGFDQCPDNYHITATRLSDNAELIFVSDWKWLLRWQTRRRALDRAFKRYDKRKRKLSTTEERTI